MRRLILPALVLGLASLVPTASDAQFITSNADPFNLYYGWYLPQQAALSLRPRPIDTINALSAARQREAVTERSGLYDPIYRSNLYESYDPARPFPERAQGRRAGGLATMSSNATGAGPGQYYERAASYYPGLRQGRGPNANIRASTMSPRSRGTPGLPNMGGMPGLR